MRPVLFNAFAKPLHQLHVLGAGTLRAATFGVGDFLTFLQVIELNALQGFGMEEQILVVRLDETKTFVRQLLDRTFGHDCTF